SSPPGAQCHCPGCCASAQTAVQIINTTTTCNDDGDVSPPYSYSFANNPRHSYASDCSSSTSRTQQSRPSRSPTQSSVSTSATSVFDQDGPGDHQPAPPSRRRQAAPTNRSRRDKELLHAARQQRSGSNRQPPPPLGPDKTRD